jgi:Lipid A 3-O-deacylase (PagL)
MKKIIPILFVTLLFITFSFAQNNEEAKNEFMVWAGGSPASNDFIGTTKNARLGIIGLRYARIFKPGKQISLKYTIDAIPAAVLSHPDYRFVSLGNNTFRYEEFRRTDYALGITPIGMQINFRRQKKVQPFVGTSGGLLVFKKKIPNDFGAKFNFTADVSGGLQVMLKDKKAVTFGYKYHHLSNGNRAGYNPGFDSNVFYVGFSIFR